MAGKRGARHGVLQGLTQAKTAELIGVSVATVSKWVRQGKLKTMPDGSIDPNDPQLQDKRAAKSNGKVGRDPSKVIDYYAERARYEKARADEKEFDIEVKRGMYVSHKRVVDTATQLYMAVREGIGDATERLSAQIASRYGLEEPLLRTMIEGQLREVLEKLADDWEGHLDGST